MKPRIGVTVSKRSGWRVFPFMALNVWLAGGKAIRWSHSSDVDLTGVDGVIIGGGDDIAPAPYGGEVRLGVRLDHDRDSMEQTALRGAFEPGLPILGICRGSQMLNILHGGNLHQDAYGVYPSKHYQALLAAARSLRLRMTRPGTEHSWPDPFLGQGLGTRSGEPLRAKPACASMGGSKARRLGGGGGLLLVQWLIT